MIHSDGQRLTEYIVDDMTTCINLECEVDGQRLAGYLVEDGARYWVWARDESDARHLAACSLVGAEADIEHAYHKATGNSLSDVWVCPLTAESLVGITFVNEEGGRRPMIEEMLSCPRRGVVACSEFP